MEDNDIIVNSTSPIRIVSINVNDQEYNPEIHIQSFIKRKITIEWGKEIF